jgi:hypothetical protein
MKRFLSAGLLRSAAEEEKGHSRRAGGQVTAKEKRLTGRGTRESLTGSTVDQFSFSFIESVHSSDCRAAAVPNVSTRSRPDE